MEPIDLNNPDNFFVGLGTDGGSSPTPTPTPTPSPIPAPVISNVAVVGATFKRVNIYGQIGVGSNGPIMGVVGFYDVYSVPTSGTVKCSFTIDGVNYTSDSMYVYNFASFVWYKVSGTKLTNVTNNKSVDPGVLKPGDFFIVQVTPMKSVSGKYILGATGNSALHQSS